MKSWIFVVSSSLLLVACGSAEKNRSAGEIPVSMSCPADQDPAQGCPTPSDPALYVGGKSSSNQTAKQEAALKMKPKGKTIEGRCELLVAGDKTPRSCSEIKVMVRSTEHGEMRDGVVDGFAVAFTDLNEKSYKFLAQSETYVVTTTDRELKPGNRVVLKVKATPRKK